MGIGAMRTRYGTNARLLHWLMVLLVVAAWTMARFGERLFDEGIDALHTATAIGLGVHLWLGLAIFVTAMLRVIWLISNPPPPPEANELSHWLISLTDPSARFTQYVLYILLFAVPIVGILLVFFEGHAPALLGLADIAVPFKEWRWIARGLRRWHVALANALVIVAIFHAATAILHQVVFGDGTLARMMPWVRRSDLK